MKEIPEESRHTLYGKRLQSPILGNYYKVFDDKRHYIGPAILDTSLTHVSYKLKVSVRLDIKFCIITADTRVHTPNNTYFETY